MLVLNNKLEVVHFSHYPAIMGSHSPNEREITCKGFDETTGVGISNAKGQALSQTEVESWINRVAVDVFRIKYLPEGWLVIFKQANEKIDPVTEVSDNLVMIMNNDNYSLYKNLDNNNGNEETPPTPPIPEPFKTYDPEPFNNELTMSDLECFDVIIKTAKDWWYGTRMTESEGAEIKARAGINSGKLIFVLDIVRMFLNEDLWKGVENSPALIKDNTGTEELNTDKSVRDDRIKAEFQQMFGYRMQYLSRNDMEGIGSLADSVIKWAQGL